MAEIASIRAVGVLDAFTYEISFDGSDDGVDAGRLSIVFGDNGTGKTTFLQGVFHLLSPGSRHRVALARLPIRQIEVTFSSGSRVSMTKEEALVGPCTLRLVHRDETTELQVALGADMPNRPPQVTPETMTYQRQLRDLLPAPMFVADDRSVESEEFAGSPSSADPRYLSPVELRELTGGAALLTWARTRELETAVSRAEASLQDAALGGLTMGASGSGSIYAEVVRQINASSDQPTIPEAKAQMLTLISAIQKRGPDFAKYGLFRLNQVDDLAKELGRVRKNSVKLQPLQQIIVPYLDSLTKQLDELELPRRRIDTYVTSVNSFLTRKRMDFQLGLGARLLDQLDEAVDLESLSSGEKHLLLLLSCAVVARDTGGLFIIDEPELSLGIEWKRTILQEMLRCTEGGKVQFLVASHSVEVMSPYRDRLAKPVEQAGS